MANDTNNQPDYLAQILAAIGQSGATDQARYRPRHVPEYLRNVGSTFRGRGKDLTYDETVRAAFENLYGALGRDGHTDPEALARVGTTLNNVGTANNADDALQGALSGIAAKIAAQENQIADQRKRDDLMTVVDMIINPTLRKRAQGLQGIKNDYTLEGIRNDRRSQTYASISAILNGAAELRQAYKARQADKAASSGGTKTGD